MSEEKEKIFDTLLERAKNNDPEVLRQRITALEGEKERLIKQVEEASKVAGQNMTGRQLAEESNTKLLKQVKAYREALEKLMEMGLIHGRHAPIMDDVGRIAGKALNQDTQEKP